MLGGSVTPHPPHCHPCPPSSEPSQPCVVAPTSVFNKTWSCYMNSEGPSLVSSTTGASRGSPGRAPRVGWALETAPLPYWSGHHMEHCGPLKTVSQHCFRAPSAGGLGDCLSPSEPWGVCGYPGPCLAFPEVQPRRAPEA